MAVPAAEDTSEPHTPISSLNRHQVILNFGSGTVTRLVLPAGAKTLMVAKLTLATLVPHDVTKKLPVGVIVRVTSVELPTVFVYVIWRAAEGGVVTAPVAS